MDVCSDVLILNDDEELVQVAAVLQEGLGLTLSVAQALQVLLRNTGSTVSQAHHRQTTGTAVTQVDTDTPRDRPISRQPACKPGAHILINRTKQTY